MTVELSNYERCSGNMFGHVWPMCSQSVHILMDLWRNPRNPLNEVYCADLIIDGRSPLLVTQ